MRIRIITIAAIAAASFIVGTGCVHNVDPTHQRVPRKVAEAGKRVLDDPGDARAWVALGDAYRSTRQYDDAYDAYQHAARLDPTDKAAEARLQALERFRPLTELERRVLADPSDDEAWGDLGDEHMAAGRSEQAMACYQRASTLDPNDSEWQNKLLSGGGAGDVDMAAMLESWGASDPTNDERIGDLADSLVAQGRIAEALQLYQRALELDPDDSEWQRKVAQYGGAGGGVEGGVVGGVEPTIAELLGGGSAEGLAALLGTAGSGGIGVAGGDDETIGDLGDTYAGQGNRDLALQHYLRALELDPTDGEWQRKVSLYGGADTLVAFLEQRLTTDPRNDEILGVLAEAYCQAGDHERGLQLYRDALTIDPADTDWQSKVALLGGMEMSIGILESKLVGDPDNDEIIGRLGDAYAFMGDRNRAMEAYTRALAVDPADSEWRNSLLAMAGSDAVLETLMPLLDSIEDDEALGDIADMLATAGEVERALEIYRKALALDPADSEWPGKIAAFSQ